MRELILTERPNVGTLEKLVRHKDIREEDRVRLESYLWKVQQGDGKIDVVYKQKLAKREGEDDKYVAEPFARFFGASNYLNTSLMQRRFRSTLFKDDENDVDIVCAHQAILLGLCEVLDKKKLIIPKKYKTLKQYVECRDEVMTKFKIKQSAVDRVNTEHKDEGWDWKEKDYIKNLLICTLFGGNVWSWSKGYGFKEGEYTVPPWYTNYHDDMTYIAKVVCKNAPECKRQLAIDKYWTKWVADGNRIQSKSSPNWKKVLCHLLQDKETDLVYNAITLLQKEGYEVTSYIYDGFQVRINPDKPLTDEVLNKIGNPKYRCKFIIKEFTEPMDLHEKNLFRPKAEVFRAALFASIARAEVAHERKDMQDKKKYFEGFFKTLEGSSKVMEIVEDRVYYHTPANFATRFANLKYKKHGDDGKKVNEHKFIQWWLEQEDRLAYRSVETIPPPLKSPEYILNLWDGWGIQKVDLKYPFIPGTTYRATTMIHKLFMQVCNFDDVAYNYLLNWFALKVQKPGLKTNVAIIFYSQAEGTGKTLIAEKIFRAFCHDKTNLLMSTTTMEDIVGKYTRAGEFLCCVLNEANLADTLGKSNELKSFITDTTFMRRQKYQPEEQITNISELIITTNNDNAIKINMTDRRWWIIEPDATHANNRSYFEPMWQAVEDPVTMRMFFEELMHRDVSRFNPSEDRPLTSTYKEVATASLTTIQNYFIDLYNKKLTEDCGFSDLFDEDHVESALLYADYKFYCEVNNKHQKIVAKNKFISNAMRQVKGLYKYRTNKERGLRVDWEEMSAWTSNYDL